MQLSDIKLKEIHILAWHLTVADLKLRFPVNLITMRILHVLINWGAYSHKMHCYSFCFTKHPFTTCKHAALYYSSFISRSLYRSIGWWADTICCWKQLVYNISSFCFYHVDRLLWRQLEVLMIRVVGRGWELQHWHKETTRCALTLNTPKPVQVLKPHAVLMCFDLNLVHLSLSCALTCSGNM